MKATFHKYQAAGNDFVIIDNRNNQFPKTPEIIQRICDRKFGVGADGLILIEPSKTGLFEMIYYNPDATQSLCGNGCRAAIRFAESLDIALETTQFNAYDGIHRALIKGHTIDLEMADVQNGREMEGGIFLDTGSPHFILFVKNAEEVDVVGVGRKWRYSGLFGDAGANINFVEIKDNSKIYVRTYERGVENETLSCGTGVTASALASSVYGCNSPLKVETKGGSLTVRFQREKQGFKKVWLEGPAEHVFSGTIDL